MDFDNQTDTLTPDVASNSITFGGTGSIIVPVGTIAQRPGSGVTSGMFRWVTDGSSGGITGALEVYTDGTNTWKALQYQSANLDGLSGLSSNGLVARTGSGTFSPRTLTAPAAGITVNNGDGVSGNPTLVLANDLSALEGLASTGIAVRTGSDAWAQRSIAVTSTNRLQISNADGSGGNPTLDLATNVTLAGLLNFNTVATVASAATTDIGAATSNIVSVTGTVTITALGTIAAGAWRSVRFAGALTLTHNATSLILPTAANITTAAGDVAEFISLGSGNWYCSSYTKANGQALSGGSGSAITVKDEGSTLTAALTSLDFVGSGVTATNTSGAVTVTISGGGGSSSTFTATAAASLSANDLVYINGSGQVDKADATTEGKECVGFVSSAVSSSATATVYYAGTMTGLVGLTAGASYYLNTTAGGIVIASSAPSQTGNVAQKIGTALSTTTLVFNAGTPVTL